MDSENWRPPPPPAGPPQSKVPLPNTPPSPLSSQAFPDDVLVLEQSLKSLLHEMDASRTLVVGSEIWIQTILQQIRCLETLTNLFQTASMTHTHNNNDYNHNKYHNKPTGRIRLLLHMWESQIVTVVRAVFYATTTLPNGRDDDHFTTRDPSTTSRIRSVHRSAAICLRALVQALAVTTATTTDHIHGHGNPPWSGRFPQVQSCILALFRGLPSTTTNHNPRSLENPTATWIELMRTIHALLQVFQDEEDEVVLLDGKEEEKAKKSSLSTTNQPFVVRLVGQVTSMMMKDPSTKHDDRADDGALVELRIQSLAVLSTCIETVCHDAMLWRAMFPGTLAAIYHCLVSCHRHASTTSLIVLECSCWGLIQKLLLTTLQPIQLTRTKTTVQGSLSSTTIMLQNLQFHSLSTLPSKKDVSASESTSATNDDAFLFNVHDKAVPHLILLLKQSMVSRSPKVKTQVIQLAHTILIETNLCWKGCNLVESALECCLLLQNDIITDDEDVSSAAQSVMRSYRTTAHDRSTILAKIRTLVQELPSIIEGRKSVDCNMHLQLIQGYLQALGTVGVTTSSSNAGGKTLTASSFPSQPFIQVMAVDLTSSSKSSRLLREVNDSGGTKGDPMPQSRLPIRRLSLEQTRLVQHVLVSFGEALGPKQGAFVVNSLMSDIFEAWHREYLSLSILEEWTGSLAVATQILFGAFSSQRRQQQQEEHEESPSKDDRRRRKILNALSSSVLPLLMDPPVNDWNLGNLAIQQGIASLLILSLEFSSAVVTLMTSNEYDGGVDSGSLFQSILYFLVCKVHGGNGIMIQETAREVMNNMAKASRRQSRSELILDHTGILFAEMLSRLRVPGGGQSSTAGNGDELFSVVFCLTWVLDECTHHQHALRYGDHTRESCNTLVELVGLLINRLDHQFLSRSVHEEETIQLARLYAAIFKYLKLLHFAKDETITTYTNQNYEQRKQSWMGLLSVFESKSDTKDVIDEDSVVDSDEENETTTRRVERSADRFGKATVTMSSEIIARLCFFLSNDSLRVRIGACESLTCGFEYLGQGTRQLNEMVREEADIRNAVYRQVATSWPSIKARLSTLTDQVVERPSPISSLLIVYARSPLSHHHPDDSGGAGRSSSAKESGRQRFFLSRLYLLIASMFECSGDFMADRFGSSVWPIMAQQFEHLIMKMKRTTSASLTRGSVHNMPDLAMIRTIVKGNGQRATTTGTRAWVDSESHLALGMLQCLHRVFSCKGSHGTVLVRIHQAVGLVLLPFLECGGKDSVDDDDQGISNAAMNAMKSILSHDADILLRPLLELSGKGIPPCPIRRLNGSIQENYNANNDSASGMVEIDPTETPRSSLADRCHELLEHIATSPEQDLE